MGWEWDWSGMGPNVTIPNPDHPPLAIVSVPKINAISFSNKTSMVGLGGMEWDWVG